MNDLVKQIVEAVVEEADHVLSERNSEDKNDFDSGELVAFYCVLDTIKNRIIINGESPEDYGLGVNLEKKYLKQSN